ALGFAHVLKDGTVDAANSKNVSQGNVTITSAGDPGTFEYCFHGLPFTAHVANVTAMETGGAAVASLTDTGARGCGTVPGVRWALGTATPGAHQVDFNIVFN